MKELEKMIDELKRENEQLSKETIDTRSYTLIVPELFKIGKYIIPDIDKKDYEAKKNLLKQWLEAPLR